MLDVALENGLGPLDIPNVEVPEEPKPVPELKLVLLLLEDVPNKLSSSVNAAYLSLAAAELPDADTSGPKPELEAGGACVGAAEKMIKKKDGWFFGGRTPQCDLHSFSHLVRLPVTLQRYNTFEGRKESFSFSMMTIHTTNSVSGAPFSF